MSSIVFAAFALLSALVLTSDAAPTRRTVCPDGKNAVAHISCCALFPILDDIQEGLFENECGAGVRESLRLAFHDAIGFSLSDPTAGSGADGSMISFSSIELNFRSNLGLEDIVAQQADILSRHNISAGDLIQFAGAVGITNCPGAPRIPFLFGRKSATGPAADGLVPEPIQTVDEILDRMANAGFSPSDVIALMAAHTIATTSIIDPTLSDAPLDTTPAIFDTQFYIETQLRGTLWPGVPANAGEALSPLASELRLQSDALLARDNRTACLWQANAANQAHMVVAFSDAMARLALLGQDTNGLVDCSDVIPIPPALTTSPILPAGLSYADVEQACANAPFPHLPTAASSSKAVPLPAPSMTFLSQISRPSNIVPLPAPPVTSLAPMCMSFIVSHLSFKELISIMQNRLKLRRKFSRDAIKWSVYCPRSGYDNAYDLATAASGRDVTCSHTGRAHKQSRIVTSTFRGICYYDRLTNPYFSLLLLRYPSLLSLLANGRSSQRGVAIRTLFDL